jgi:hypothetical protein
MPDRRHAKAVALSATAVILGSWLLLSAPAARADCPVLDLACLTDAVTETVDDVIDTATTTTQQVVDETTDVTDPVVDAVVGVVDDVDDTVSEVVETVVETVDPTVGGVLPSPAPDGDPSDPPADTGVTADAGPTQPEGTLPAGEDDSEVVVVFGEGVTDPSRPADGGDASRTSATGETGSSTEPVPAAAVPAGATVSTTDPTQIDVASPGVREPARFGFGNAVKRLAFPLALVLAVGVFLLAQHRFDRRAPKLALAPVEADVAAFS